MSGYTAKESGLVQIQELIYILYTQAPNIRYLQNQTWKWNPKLIMYIVACAQLLPWGEISLQSLGSERPLMLHGFCYSMGWSREAPLTTHRHVRATQSPTTLNMRRLVGPSGELMPEHRAWKESTKDTTTCNIQDLAQDQPLPGLPVWAAVCREAFCLVCSTGIELMASHTTTKGSAARPHPWPLPVSF